MKQTEYCLGFLSVGISPENIEPANNSQFRKSLLVQRKLSSHMKK